MQNIRFFLCLLAWNLVNANKNTLKMNRRSRHAKMHSDVMQKTLPSWNNLWIVDTVQDCKWWIQFLKMMFRDRLVWSEYFMALGVSYNTQFPATQVTVWLSRYQVCFLHSGSAAREHKTRAGLITHNENTKSADTLWLISIHTMRTHILTIFVCNRQINHKMTYNAFFLLQRLNKFWVQLC